MPYLLIVIKQEAGTAGGPDNMVGGKESHQINVLILVQVGIDPFAVAPKRYF